MQATQANTWMYQQNQKMDRAQEITVSTLNVQTLRMKETKEESEIPSYHVGSSYRMEASRQT
ncbi:hypothetical protein C0J52_12842 [Blattella germanica]|nr:hypothetical protein C0J52_12842 [Blattella germanica]